MKKYLRIISLPILLMQTSVLAAEHHLNNETSTDFTDYGTATTFRSKELESLYVQQNDRDDADSYFLTSSKLLNRGDEVFYSNSYANLFKQSNESIYASASLVNDDFLVKPIISPILPDPSPLIMLKPPRKPTIRGRVELPYIDPKELGIVDLFKGYGVDISSIYDFQSNPILFNPIIKDFKFELISSYKLTNLLIYPFGQVSPLDQNEGGRPKYDLTARTFDPYQIENQLLKSPIDQLNETEIIRLFKWLTYDRVFADHDADSFGKLKELIQDPRSREIILAASKEAEGHIQKAISKLPFLKPKVIKILFSNSEIVDHLGTQITEKGRDLLLENLMMSVYLNFDDFIPLFYKSQFVFRHLLSTIKSKKTDALVDLKTEEEIIFEAGLVMSFSSQKDSGLEKLAHPTLITYIEQNPQVLSRLVTQSIEERNPQSARLLIENPRLPITLELLQDAINIPALWDVLTEMTQQDLLKKVQTVKSTFTIQQLQQNHRLLKASEHALTGHPKLLDDMTLYVPDLAQRYQEVTVKLQETDVSQESYLDLFMQKKELEKAFLNKLKELNEGALLTPPWSHAEADYAYSHKIFGQGVTSLVVELAELPEYQKDKLLKERLGERTSYGKKARRSKTRHNIGVTSLVAQMAPLTKVISSTTRQIETLKDAIQAGEFPFINCSWGPASALDENKTISIFSSVDILNNLLGREDIVLIKSAGNEGLSLSVPDLKGDPAGILFSKLLNKLDSKQMTNLILAINLKPTNEVMLSSNTPGSLINIFRNSLSTQGSGVYWLDEAGDEYLPIQDGGTSSAAPEITGAAALVRSYKPHFSPILIKACLLHSGVREFMIYGDDGKPRQWIYESKPKEGLNMPQIQYSFEKYGMGILNVKSACIFSGILDTYLADLKEKNIETPLSFEIYESLRGKLTEKLNSNLNTL